ncbi:Serine-aspartate repeat-containing protein D precursor [Gemmata obscuriglobus]|uniref:SdrD B-like domain-containing protein n=1 Tax=Gemmata obscuriglobus TaxID=114 RepID=UPI0002FB068D|nr:SdrD B-like domain-containing protein [Gemmata obscuriglobus]QEG31300.1 Serine-aspartate repeat-containing protein D precursor [Gemmata obscuriglobus]VTS10639.1 Conserved repeat domain OS=Roseiflexus sp. (strain RS-1) GN=RoseRS_1068 PE=4 SV=1: Cna_B: Cna_B [Gemmata obscuriglobus UQM 2246]
MKFVTRPARPNRFAPKLEQLQQRDVPALLVPSSLSGFVYVDADCDGRFDAGEQPIADVTVTLSGTEAETGLAVNATTKTGSDGKYTFADLNPGTYTVRETQPSGYADGADTQGTPGTGITTNDAFNNIVLNSGVDGTDNNFGEKLAAPPATGSLSGTVYCDANKNGRLDSGEGGISGVKVTLSGPAGTRTAVTDASGRYGFGDLIAGTYTVTEAQPAGYGQGQNTPGTPANGSVTGDVIGGIAVTGTALTGYNFGEIKVPSCDDHGGNDCDSGHDKDKWCDHGKGPKDDKDCDDKKFVICGVGTIKWEVKWDVCPTPTKPVTPTCPTPVKNRDKFLCDDKFTLPCPTPVKPAPVPVACPAPSKPVTCPTPPTKPTTPPVVCPTPVKVTPIFSACQPTFGIKPIRC